MTQTIYYKPDGKPVDKHQKVFHLGPKKKKHYILVDGNLIPVLTDRAMKRRRLVYTNGAPLPPQAEKLSEGRNHSLINEDGTETPIITRGAYEMRMAKIRKTSSHGVTLPHLLTTDKSIETEEDMPKPIETVTTSTRTTSIQNQTSEPSTQIHQDLLTPAFDEIKLSYNELFPDIFFDESLEISVEQTPPPSADIAKVFTQKPTQSLNTPTSKNMKRKPSNQKNQNRQTKSQRTAVKNTVTYLYANYTFVPAGTKISHREGKHFVTAPDGYIEVFTKTFMYNSRLGYADGTVVPLDAELMRCGRGWYYVIQDKLATQVYSLHYIKNKLLDPDFQATPFQAQIKEKNNKFYIIHKGGFQTELLPATEYKTILKHEDGKLVDPSAATIKVGLQYYLCLPDGSHEEIFTSNAYAKRKRQLMSAELDVIKENETSLQAMPSQPLDLSLLEAGTETVTLPFAQDCIAQTAVTSFQVPEEVTSTNEESENGNDQTLDPYFSFPINVETALSLPLTPNKLHATTTMSALRSNNLFQPELSTHLKPAESDILHEDLDWLDAAFSRNYTS